MNAAPGPHGDAGAGDGAEDVSRRGAATASGAARAGRTAATAGRRLDAAPPEGLERRWFVGEGCALAIDRASPESASPDVAHLHDAVLLGEHAELLDCIDAWLGVDVDWRPALPEAIGARTFDATLASAAAEDERRVGFAADAARAGALGALPESCGGRVTLHRHRLEAEVLLDRFALAADDLARWEEGGVVLLPASFRRGWKPVLAATSTAAPPVPDGTAAVCEIALAERVEVPAESLEGGSTAAGSPETAAAAPPEGRRCRVRLHRAAGDERAGALVPGGGTLVRIGAGLALVLGADSADGDGR